MLIFFMYGINLQLFDSKLRISIFDTLPKNLHLRKTCGFAQKKLSKTKISFFMCNLCKKNISGFPQIAQKNSAKPCKTHCVSCTKIAQKFAKKICVKLSHFLETLCRLQSTIYLSYEVIGFEIGYTLLRSLDLDPLGLTLVTDYFSLFITAETVSRILEFVDD